MFKIIISTLYCYYYYYYILVQWSRICEEFWRCRLKWRSGAVHSCSRICQWMQSCSEVWSIELAVWTPFCDCSPHRNNFLSVSDLPLGLVSDPTTFATTILHVFSSSYMHATCLTHFILLHWTSQLLLYAEQEHALWSSSLCAFLQPPVQTHECSQWLGVVLCGGWETFWADWLQIVSECNLSSIFAWTQCVIATAVPVHFKLEKNFDWFISVLMRWPLASSPTKLRTLRKEVINRPAGPLLASQVAACSVEVVT
jgi:hypothetical protein